MTTLCLLHETWNSAEVFEAPTMCGRWVAGLTRGTIPLGANATRDRTLVSCEACKAKLVDDRLTGPEMHTETGRITATKVNLQNLPRKKT